MRNTKIYLDTSFINYLVATRFPDKMKDSLALWEIFVSDERFEIVLSETVNQELQACYEPKRSRLFEKLAELPFELLSETPEITDLANRYVEFEVLHSKH